MRKGALDKGLCICLSLVLLGLVLCGTSCGWMRLGLPGLSNLPGPIQHFKSAILNAWRDKVSADLCTRQGFRCGSLFDIGGSQQLLNSTHARERDTSLPQSIWLVGFGMFSFCVWYG